METKTTMIMGRDNFYEAFFIQEPTKIEEHSQGVHYTACAGSLYGNTGVIWSAKLNLPAVGTKVWINMNGIGYAKVVGYFEWCGFVGIMAKPTNPPAYYKRQSKEAKLDWQRAGVGCFFGSEVLLQKPLTKLEIAQKLSKLLTEASDLYDQMLNLPSVKNDQQQKREWQFDHDHINDARLYLTKEVEYILGQANAKHAPRVQGVK